MGLPKCRLDVWHPRIQTVDSQGGISSVEILNAWVKCDTAEDISINLQRANALTSVEIEDSLYTPRVAHLTLTNKPRNFRAFDTDTYDYQYQNSGGGNQGSALKLRTSWGPLSRFFKEFLHVRIVDLETHMVLFAGQIYKIQNRYEGQRGAYIELDCRDALQALKDIKLKNLVKGVTFPSGTRRSEVIQQFVSLGYNYLTARGDNNPDVKTLEPSLSSLQSLDLSSSALTLNSDDNNTGATDDNSFYRFEKSEKAMVETEWKANKSGSDNLLQEMARWAILEPHEDETQIDQFGYDFFADADIGQSGLNHTVAPRPQMLNYYKRGNRLSSAGSANQQADVHGLTVKLPVIGSAVAHQGATQHNVGSLAGAITSSATSIPVSNAASNYAGQVITIDSEQLFVSKILSDEFAVELLNVVRGWDGSTAASHSNSAVIKEIRPAHAVMHQSFDFEDSDDELYTEAVLEYVENHISGDTVIIKERTKRFEILYVTEISGDFAWSGKRFDAVNKHSTDGGAGVTSAQEFVLRKPNGTVLTNARTNNSMGLIQYQSAETITGSANFGYILISDLDKAFPTANDASDAYVEIRGLTAPYRTCRVNLNATEAIQGRPATAWAGGNTSSDDGRFFRKVLSISRKNADEVDDLRGEVAARLARATNPLQRGSFQMSKAPYYWYDGVIRSEEDVTAGQTLTIKAQNGTAAVNVTNYGIREGMVVHKMTADYAGIAQYVSGGVSKDVYGYITALTSDSSFTVDLSDSQTFADDDLVRIFIPLRAGDTVKVDNILANIYGEHLITKLSFTEDPQPRTSFDTIGENEPRIRLKFGGVSRASQSVWNQMLADKVTTTERITRSATPVSNQTFKWDGTWSFPDYNTITWAGSSNSNVTLADGTTYQVVDGSTNDSTYGLGTDMADGTAYVLYIDPEAENPDTNAYHIYTRSEADFIQDEDKLLFMFTAPTTAVIEKPNCVKGPNFQTDFAFPHSSLNADGKQSAVTVGGTAPTNPAVGDIFIDTATTNNWKRWDGSAWVTYDLGTAKAIGTAAAVDAAAADTKADRKRQVFNQTATPSTNLQQGDLWINAALQIKIYDTSAGWQLRDDAGAVNLGGTDITGGRIGTQTIVLTDGGSNTNILGADGASIPTAGTRIVLSHNGIFGWNSDVAQFRIESADGVAHFGGSSGIINNDGIFIQGGNDNSLGRLYLRGATASTTNLATGGDGNDGRYSFTNYAGTLYIFSTGMSEAARAISPTVNATFRLGGSTFGWEALYLGDTTNTNNATHPPQRLSYDDGHLKWPGNSIELGGSSTGRLYASDILLLTANGGVANADSLHSHSSGGVTDHGALSGLADADHSAYSLSGHSHSAVTSIATTSPISGGTITSTGTITHATSGVSAAQYTLATVTVDATGHVTAAANGSGGGGSGTINSGTTNRFAYYTGSTTLSSATSSSAYLYATGIYINGDSNFFTNMFVGTGTDVEIGSSLLYRTSSSRKYKENIVDLLADSSRVYELSPKSFKYLDREIPKFVDGERTDEMEMNIGSNSFGYIAEDVHEILPELVNYENDEPDSVRYKLVSVLLLEEMKKLKDRIEVLEGNG